MNNSLTLYRMRVKYDLRKNQKQRSKHERGYEGKNLFTK